MAWAYEASYNWHTLSSDYYLCQNGSQQSPIALSLGQGLSHNHIPDFGYTVSDSGRETVLLSSCALVPSYPLTYWPQTDLHPQFRATLQGTFTIGAMVLLSRSRMLEIGPRTRV